jgi:UDP-N-acetylmuramate dehydrogenase
VKIEQNVSLADYSTMGLGGQAANLCSVSDAAELKEALDWAEANNLPAIMIGSGSNVVWRDEGFNGLIIVNNILKYEVVETTDQHFRLTVGAGEIWDSVVERSVSAGLTGIEALSLIPGKSGATPVQNVGAYGQDIAQTLETVEAYDIQSKQLVNLAAVDCEFGYRTSRFKTTDQGRFFITSISLNLRKSNPEPPLYSSVQAYFDEHKIAELTPLTLRQAVIAIRQYKLPDPAVVRNNGSFFANPIITEEQLASLSLDFQNIPHWSANEGVKLSAAWLIEQAGFKDFHDPITGMSTWPRQPLVLVNEKANSTSDLLDFKEKIVTAVEIKFGVVLEQEPELLPKI